MNDRELLELAAKAAGFEWRYENDGRMSVFMYDRRWVFWNPLADDGDAFRLAMRLKLILEPNLSQCNDVTYSHFGYSELPNVVDAMRAAIVQCAASIGAAL